MLPSQWAPVNWSGQLQSYPPTTTLHIPPFSHGLGWQTSFGGDLATSEDRLNIYFWFEFHCRAQVQAYCDKIWTPGWGWVCHGRLYCQHLKFVFTLKYFPFLACIKTFDVKTYSPRDPLHNEVRSTAIYNDISSTYLPRNIDHRSNMGWANNHLKYKTTCLCC